MAKRLKQDGAGFFTKLSLMQRTKAIKQIPSMELFNKLVTY